MNRDDVIDVLTAVAACDRRTIGEFDVTAWSAVIGDLPKDLCLIAVVDHYRDKPGTWLEPGHIHQRVRAIIRDRLDRESDASREARQALQDSRFGDMPELSPRMWLNPAPSPDNALIVACPWCRASVGCPCCVPATGRPLRKSRAHPARIEAAEARKATAWAVTK